MVGKVSLNEKLEKNAISPVMPIMTNNWNQDGSKKRGPEEIKAELLRAGLCSMLKTVAMSRCNLSSSQIKKYARILIGKKLLSVENKNGKQVFATTQRGKIWLEQFRKLREIENGVGLINTSYIT